MTSRKPSLSWVLGIAKERLMALTGGLFRARLWYLLAPPIISASMKARPSQHAEHQHRHIHHDGDRHTE